MADNYTHGPLRVVQSDSNPNIVQIVKSVNGSDLVVFEERRPCSSSEDKSVDDAMSCRKMWRISEAERELYAQMNQRHLNDMYLRAAAPDLLKALVDIVEYIDAPCTRDRSSCLAVARTAIAKATGEQL